MAEEKGCKEGSTTAPKGSLIYLHEAALSLSQLWSQCARGRGRGLGTSLLHLHSLSLSLSLSLSHLGVDYNDDGCGGGDDEEDGGH